MYELLDHCPSCGNHTFTNELICTDHLVSNEAFVIVKCGVCDLSFTNPRPKPEELGQFYQSDDYISHSNKTRSLTDFIYNIARSFALKRKLRLIQQYHNKGSLLDYGCGTGLFLKTCSDAGWNITGIEPDLQANAIAQANTNNAVHESIDQLDKDQTFDVIALWHVLEHIPNLQEIIGQLKKRLTKSGVLIIAVPNHKSWDAQHYKELWAAYDVPRHLYHFSQETMKALMRLHGLKLKATLPMKLDAYYVSLLSEQHKGKKGITKYCSAILNGYKSNAYASKNNQNYSSLIYVFKK